MSLFGGKSKKSTKKGGNPPNNTDDVLDGVDMSLFEGSQHSNPMDEAEKKSLEDPMNANSGNPSNIGFGGSSSNEYKSFNKHRYLVRIGKRGGKYILVQGKKKYI